MAEPEILFEVDASQLLAKLHLAGLQPCSYDQNKEFIVNTGIKNDDPKAKPENPGKVQFDLGNSQGQYELGFVTTIGPYPRSTGLGNVVSQITEIIAKLKTSEGDKSEDTSDKDEEVRQNKSLLDKDKDAQKKDGAGDKEEAADSSEKDPKKAEELKEYEEVLEKINKVIGANEAQLKSSGIDIAKFQKEQLDAIGKSATYKKEKGEKAQTPSDINDILGTHFFIEFVEALIKMLEEKSKGDESNEAAKKKYDDMKQKAQDKAGDQLSKYLTVFVGPEKASKFNVDDLVMIHINEKVKDSKDNSLVKNYEIIPMADKDRELELQKFQTDPANCIEKVCFKTGYTVQIDK